MNKMKVMLMVGVCTLFWALSGLSTASADDSVNLNRAIYPDGIQAKQGWSCSKALLFYRRYGYSYSKLKRADSSWLMVYDNIQEDAVRGSSDVYGTVCVYIYDSAGHWVSMYSY